MQRSIKIIVVWLAGLFCAGSLYAQSSVMQQQPALPGRFLRLQLLPGDSVSSTAPQAAFHTMVPSNYYTQHFGFFCEKELKLEKSTGVPFRFRLGSIESTDRLEGKRK